MPNFVENVLRKVLTAVGSKKGESGLGSTGDYEGVN